ncbi:ferredoxin [Nocardia sp. NPDC006630]|uniref:ferredoxin n=1 Tax=Nocardia sp. NPDC006630 TaxID=3157181 RepID=UPI0033AD17BB
MKVVVEQDKCVSSGQCALQGAGVFDQRDEDGVVVLLEEYPAADKAGAVHQAAAGCPAKAIHIEQ